MGNATWIWRRHFWRHANEFSKRKLSGPTTDNLKQNPTCAYYTHTRAPERGGGVPRSSVS